MKKISKGNRHRSHQRGKKFVKEFRGLNYHPTYNTEVNIPGKYAQVDVTLNLGAHPLPELTDITPLEQMKANMEDRRRVRVRTAPAPVAPIASEPVQEKKTKRITTLGWVAIAAGALCAVCGVGYAFKKSA